ncbi:MAG TPA: 5'-deoxynucleotidase [Clostridiaceae bacterium]|nr:5'-deoxynucleotidase [Clostridiaceae bacterium]
MNNKIFFFDQESREVTNDQESGEATNFFAMLHRMRYINRWSLMKNTETENIMEHSYEVAVIAHALALIRCEYFSEDRICPAPEKVAVMALFHDLPEIMTGDMPTPVKYATTEMRESYGVVEHEAAVKLLTMLPGYLQEHYRPLVLPDITDKEVLEITLLVKAADRFSAYIKCLDELKSGNREFKNAMQGVRERLGKMNLPEISWFMENVIPSYYKTLDELDD